MKKVLIIGCPGAGKSTFGRAMSEKTGMPLYYLDMIWHRADRTNISREEFDERLAELIPSDEWIIDGNYKRILPVRLQEANTVFFLDYPIEVCMQGAMERLANRAPMFHGMAVRIWNSTMNSSNGSSTIPKTNSL